jgi:hypothetical protein
LRGFETYLDSYHSGDVCQDLSRYAVSSGSAGASLRMARALRVLAPVPGQEKFSATRLDDALQALKSASTPLLQNLNAETRSAVRGDDPA